MARLQLFAFGIKLFQGDEAVEVTYHILCSSINDMTAIVTWLRILPFGHYDILFEDKVLEDHPPLYYA